MGHRSGHPKVQYRAHHKSHLGSRHRAHWVVVEGLSAGTVVLQILSAEPCGGLESTGTVRQVTLMKLVKYSAEAHERSRMIWWSSFPYLALIDTVPLKLQGGQALWKQRWIGLSQRTND